MKQLNVLIISIVAISVMLISRVANAQPVIVLTDTGQVVDCIGDLENISTTDKRLHTIVEEDYPYLKNMECIKNGYFSDQRKLDLQLRDMNRNDNSNFVLTGYGPNINIEANYDQDGNLVDAMLVQKNVPIPRAILRFIYSSDEFTGWKMIETEKTVKDFDVHQTEYNMTLANGNETKVLQFRDYGDSITLVDQQ